MTMQSGKWRLKLKMKSEPIVEAFERRNVGNS